MVQANAQAIVSATTREDVMMVVAKIVRFLLNPGQICLISTIVLLVILIV
jgi:hypothetical protein